MTDAQILGDVAERVLELARLRSDVEQRAFGGPIVRWTNGERSLRLGMVAGYFVIQDGDGPVDVPFKGAGRVRSAVSDGETAKMAADIVRRLQRPASIHTAS